jgi:serine/threonine protein kinase
MTEKSAIWSLGCMLFELLVGQPLFACHHNEASLLAVIEERVSRIPQAMVDRSPQRHLLIGGRLPRADMIPFRRPDPTPGHGPSPIVNVFVMSARVWTWPDDAREDESHWRVALLDLLALMLMIDPDERADLDTLLHHPFLMELPFSEI